MPRKKTTAEFISDVITLYGDLYNCDKVDYTGNRNPVILICSNHGEFTALPVNILSKKTTCKECGKDRHRESIKKRTDTTETFITKAKIVHGNRYNYEKVEYINAKTKVTIICKDHGNFDQTPDDHLRNRGCPKCGKISVGNAFRKSTEQFINEAREIYDNKFDYSKVNYINYHTKVTIICPKHGEFEQTPSNHLHYDCIKCGIEKVSQINRKNTKEFIQDAVNVHGDKFDYSKVNYINGETKVIIICPKHGEFEQTPANHYRHDCKKCSEEITSELLRKKTENFIEKSNKIHEDKYTYDKVNYLSAGDKVIITCPDHGDFEQIANVHLLGKGCPDCGKERSVILMTKTNQEFIEDAVNIHEDKYDYSLVEYVNTNTQISIICTEHGEFNQLPRAHLRGAGCPNCNRFKTEKLCISIIEHLTDHKFIKCRPSFLDGLELDGFNADLQLAIEYNGEQHYKIVDYFHRNGIYDLLTQVEHDKLKKRKCQENGIYLMIVPHYVKDKEKFIKEQLNKYEKWIYNKD